MYIIKYKKIQNKNTKQKYKTKQNKQNKQQQKNQNKTKTCKLIRSVSDSLKHTGNSLYAAGNFIYKYKLVSLLPMWYPWFT